PAPKTTTARVSGSSSTASRACWSSSIIAWLIALRRRGRLSTMMDTGPSLRSSIVSNESFMATHLTSAHASDPEFLDERLIGIQTTPRSVGNTDPTLLGNRRFAIDLGFEIAKQSFQQRRGALSGIDVNGGYLPRSEQGTMRGKFDPVRLA